MKYAQHTSGVNLITSVLVPLQNHPVSFAQSGLDPNKEYEVSMYCYWNLSVANYHIFANLKVNGNEVGQNTIIPTALGGTQPLEIKSIKSPDSNGTIELQAVFSKTNNTNQPLRIDGIYYSIEEIN